MYVWFPTNYKRLIFVPGISELESTIDKCPANTVVATKSVGKELGSLYVGPDVVEIFVGGNLVTLFIVSEPCIPKIPQFNIHFSKLYFSFLIFDLNYELPMWSNLFLIL